MPKMLQIRNVPDDVHRKLKVRAAQEGVSLSELLAREARRLAEQPTAEQMRERLLSRPRIKLRTPPARGCARREIAGDRRRRLGGAGVADTEDARRVAEPRWPRRSARRW